MRIFLVLLGCYLAAAASLAREPVPDKILRPSVFLITIDTLRADHVHCYGYDRIRTPALDQLAKEGVRFAQAFTPSPITISSHASILTGLLPSSHGVSDFGVPLAATHLTLAELLVKRGYRTAAFIGAVILDSKSLAPGLDRGFEFYDNFPKHATAKSRWGRLERRGMEVEQHAESWLNAHPDGSHFAWIHFYDPHDPYEPPPPYSAIYKDRLYDGEIAYADAALGHFVAYLKKQGWYDGALIVVVGDHGEGLGEHNEDTHGIFLYDSTTHVPLLVKLPNNHEAGQKVESQVRTTDILPTILEVLGLPGNTAIRGLFRPPGRRVALLPPAFRTILPMATLFFGLSSVARADDFWKQKPPAQWSHAEALKIVRHSPWAKVEVVMFLRRENQTSRGTVAPLEIEFTGTGTSSSVHFFFPRTLDGAALLGSGLDAAEFTLRGASFAARCKFTLDPQFLH